MGMMLRRNNRKPDYAPQVNGKMVEKAPKKRSLTDKPVTNTNYTPKYNTPNK